MIAFSMGSMYVYIIIYNMFVSLMRVCAVK